MLFGSLYLSSYKMTNSTRRFNFRPSSVSLLAIGDLEPNPHASSRDALNACSD